MTARHNASLASIPTPTATANPATKGYVDTQVAAVAVGTETSPSAIIKAGLALRNSSPAIFGFIGSSTTAGQAATTTGKRWVNRFFARVGAMFALDSGTHPGVVTSIPSSPGNGITFINLGVGSTTTGSLTQATAQSLGSKNPVVIFHQAVMNDYTNGTVDPAVTKTNVLTRMGWINGAATRPVAHVFVSTFPRYDFGTPSAGRFYQDYIAKYQEIVDANPNTCMLFEFWDDFADIGCGYGANPAAPTSPPDYWSLMYGDNVHMNDEGHLFLAELVASRLGFSIPAGTVTAADVTAPTAPTSFAIGTTTSSTAPCSWTAATDDIGVDHYDVFYRSPSGTGSWVQSNSGPITGTSHTIGGAGSSAALSPSTTIEGYAVAYDAAGNPSSISNSDSDTTAAGGGGFNLWAAPGLIAIYDPELDSAVTALANGAAVASLTPAAGTELAALTQSTSGQRPTVQTAAYNGKRALVFDGSNDFLSTATWGTAHGPGSPAADTVTYVFYGEFTVGQILSSTSSTNYLVARKESTANDNMFLFAGTTASFGTVPNIGDTARVIVIKMKSGTSECRVWNHSLTSTAYTMSTNSARYLPAFRIGTNGGASQFFLNGKMGLAALIAGDTLDADIQTVITQVNTYFAGAPLT